MDSFALISRRVAPRVAGGQTRRVQRVRGLVVVLAMVATSGVAGCADDGGPAPTTTTTSVPPMSTTTAPTTTTVPPAPTTTTTPEPPSSQELEAAVTETVERLVADAASGGARVSISVQAVARGSTPVAVAPRLPFLAGSASKVYWAAAAAAARGPGAVEPEATLIFEWSDNDAAGRIVDLADPNAINLFLAGPAGADDTAFYFWGFGGDGRGSALYPGPFGGNNPTTTADAVRFMVRLDRGDLLTPRATGFMRDWLTRSPRNTSHPSTYGGLFGDRLPPEVQADVLHKGGWLPGKRDQRGCCAAFDDLFLDMGIIETPAGARWAVSVAISGGGDLAHNADVIRHSVCEVYRTVAEDEAWDCGTVA